MDNTNPAKDRINTQIPVSPSLAAQTVLNETKPKRRGQISINKSFIIIYALVLVAIFGGPLVFTDDETLLTPLAILINGGALLITVLVLLHIFLLWREAKKNKNN